MTPIFIATFLCGLGEVVARENKSSKTALVIGNSRYESSLGKLRNAENDATAIAETLRSLGFKVIEKTNVNRDQLTRAVEAFRESLKGSEIAIFYYAGHGVSISGSNYLVPIKSGFEPKETDLNTLRLLAETRLFNAEQAVADMCAGGARCNLVILDACRTPPALNPETVRSFGSQKGLSEMQPPAGSLIAFAADDGQVAFDGDGKNGLFTEELLRNMRTPGLTIEQVFKRTRASVIERTKGRQVPAEYSRLVGEDVYLAGQPTGAVSSSPVAPPETAPTAVTTDTDPMAKLRGWSPSGGSEEDLLSLISTILEDSKLALESADSPSPRILTVADQCGELAQMIPSLIPPDHPRYSGLQAKALSRHGDALLLLGRPEDAHSAFEAAVGIDREDAYLLYNRGRASLALGHLEDAKADFNSAAGPRFSQPGAKRLALEALSSLK